MFVHGRLYSVLGRGEWAMFVERIPPREYARLANKFRPDRFNADDWISLAENAGMKYLTFTARHHDGFCLYDSEVRDFTSVKIAARPAVLKGPQSSRELGESDAWLGDRRAVTPVECDRGGGFGESGAAPAAGRRGTTRR